MRDIFITKRFIAVVLLLLVMGTAHAADRYWIGAGGAVNNWNNTANWSTTSGGAGGASVPGSGDVAIFDANGTGNCTINTSVNVGGINVGSGYTGTISQGANTIIIGSSNAVISGGTFTGGSAAITINGSFTISGAAFTSTSDVLTISGNYTISSGSFTHNSGTVKFTVTSTLTGSTDFYTVEFGAASAAATYTIASGTKLTIVNDLNYSGSNSIVINTGTIEAKRDINLNNTANGGGGSGTVRISGTSDQTLKGTGSSFTNRMCNVEIDKSSGTLYLQNTITVVGNWTYINGTIDAGTSMVIFLTGKTISGTHSLYRVMFTGGTYTISDTITVNGLFNTTLSGDIVINTGLIEAKGNITLSNTGNGSGGSATINISGTGDQTLTGSGISTAGRLCNVNIDKPSGTLTLNSVISCGGNWIYNQGTADASTNLSTVVLLTTKDVDAEGSSGVMGFHHLNIFNGTRTITGELNATGNLSISSTATLTNTTHSVKVGGNWSNSGTYNRGTATVTFNGPGDVQSIRKSSGAETFYDLAVNKEAGYVRLDAAVTLTNSLSLSKGNIVTTSTKLLTLNDNVTATGGSDASYVSGPMKKIGNEAFTFPLGGTSGGTNYYHPISITAPSLTDDAYTAEYFPTGYANDSLLVDSLEEVSDCEYWMLEITNGSSNVYGTVAWNANSCIANYADLTVAGWNGTQWTDLGRGEVTILDQNMGTINTSSAITFPVTNIPITIAVKKNTDAYALLKRKLDGGYYLVRDGKLMFRFDEEYNDIDNKLTFNIYDQEHAVIVSNASMPVASQPASDYGDNRISINILSCNISSNGNIGPGYYTLEVMNEKGEKWYLRFKHETSITNVCSTTGNGGGN